MYNKIVISSPNTEIYLEDHNQLKVNIFTTISKQLLIDLLSNDNYYKKIKNIYEHNELIIITLIDENNKIKKDYRITKVELIELLQKINIQEFPELKNKYNELFDYVSYEKYQNKTHNNKYEIEVDGTKYIIPVNYIYNFMNLSTDKFYEIIKHKNKFIYNIPLDIFLYIVKTYFNDNNIIQNYYVNNNIKNKLEEIKSCKYIDIEMINKYTSTDDILTEICESLQNDILSGIPPQFSNLEKAIYIYIKMCKLLTYDEEFYAVNQKGPLTEKHETIDNLAKISRSNNKVVCYEFNAIYAYMLKKIGINYKKFIYISNGTEMENDNDFFGYSDGHTFLKFRYKKYLIKADSTTTILDGDFLKAKLNQPLVGLICENKNEQSKQEFNNILNKVYNYIAEHEPKISNNKPGIIESYDDIVSQFIQVTDKTQPISLEEKIDILIKKVNESKLIGMDAYSYLLDLRNILFTTKEQKNNIKISIIRDSNTISARALAIISLMLPEQNNRLQIKRYLFRPGHDLVPISLDLLEKKFKEGSMGYIGKNSPEIPGLKK